MHENYVIRALDDRYLDEWMVWPNWKRGWFGAWCALTGGPKFVVAVVAFTAGSIIGWSAMTVALWVFA